MGHAGWVTDLCDPPTLFVFVILNFITVLNMIANLYCYIEKKYYLKTKLFRRL